MGTVAPPPADEGGVRGRLPRGHRGQRADIFTTPAPSSPPAMGTDQTADIAGDIPMEPEGEGEDLPPAYRSSE